MQFQVEFNVSGAQVWSTFGENEQLSKSLLVKVTAILE